jgi:transposase
MPKSRHVLSVVLQLREFTITGCRRLKDLPFQEKDCYLVLKKRRYRCSCDKRFLEKYDFLAFYQQRSIRLVHAIADKLRATVPLKHIAEQTNVSSSTVSRILDTISYSCPSLKDAVAIDEFKGNADTGKYQCILVNPKQHTVMDILPDRTNSHLSACFREMERSHKLILTRYDKLKDENKHACDLMPLYNDQLRKAHMLKEWFYRICQNEKYSIQRTEFYDWIRNAESCGIKEFEKWAATYRHWSKYILNAFKYGLTNGVTEGFNNKVKVLKRNSYGIRNFNRFRTRILHSCN